MDLVQAATTTTNSQRQQEQQQQGYGLGTRGATRKTVDVHK